MLSLDKDSFITLSLYVFYLFICFLVLFKSYNIILNRVNIVKSTCSEKESLCIAPSIWEKVSSFSPLSITLAVGFFCRCSLPGWGSFLYWCEFYLESSVNVVNYTDWFSDAEPTLCHSTLSFWYIVGSYLLSICWRFLHHCHETIIL